MARRGQGGGAGVARGELEIRPRLAEALGTRQAVLTEGGKAFGWNRRGEDAGLAMPGFAHARWMRRCARRMGRDRLSGSYRPDPVRRDSALQDIQLLPRPGDREDE